MSEDEELQVWLDAGDAEAASEEEDRRFAERQARRSAPTWDTLKYNLRVAQYAKAIGA